MPTCPRHPDGENFRASQVAAGAACLRRLIASMATQTSTDAPAIAGIVQNTA